MTATHKDITLLRFVFADDGLIPNNKLPMLFYRQAIKIGAEHPQKTIEGLFGLASLGRDVEKRHLYLPPLSFHSP
jgi:hypothetical protein